LDGVLVASPGQIVGDLIIRLAVTGARLIVESAEAEDVHRGKTAQPLDRLNEARNERARIEVVVLRGAEEFVVLNPEAGFIDEARVDDPRVRPHIVIGCVAESTPVSKLGSTHVRAKRCSCLVERSVRRPEETARDTILGSDVVVASARE